MRLAKILYLLPLILLVLPTVAASTRTTGSGSYTATAKATETKTAGPNMIITYDASFTATGTIVGTCTGTQTNESHQSSLTFQGSCTFTGSINDKTGTAVFRYNAFITSTIFHGTFTVSNGTGGLAGLHAQGTFGPTTYTINLQFNP